MTLLDHAARIARAGLRQERKLYGRLGERESPWLGSWRATSADLAPPGYMTESDSDAPSSNFLFVPRSRSWKRRLGQTIKFETSVAAALGLLPLKWNASPVASAGGAKCRRMREFSSSSFTDNIPSLIALTTRETISSGTDTGRYSHVYIRDQVANSNRTVGSDFSTSTTYPVPGTEQTYKFVPLWHDSGEGGITRGVDEFQRRFFFGGSRDFERVGNWWYFPSLYGTPSRWSGTFASATAAARLIPSGPLPPTHAGTLTVGNQVESGNEYMRTDLDVADGGWTAQTGSDLYAMIDEETVSDTDYIQCTTGGGTCEIRLSDFVSTPAADETITIRYRAGINSGSGGTLGVDLYEGATLRISTSVPPTTNYVDYSYQLTPTQITSIGTWSNMSVKMNYAGGAGGSVLRVSYFAVERGVSEATLEGGWRGSDKFYYSVAYRFEDDSIWMPCTPRGPNTILTNGYNLFQVSAGNSAAGYQKITWSNIPIGPYGVKSRILLRTPKIDASTESILALNPTDLRVVWEIKDNTTTTYDDFYADDDALGLDVDELLIRSDHRMPPRARYIFAGDSRVCVSYGGDNPCAIVLAPVNFAHASTYDRNLADTSSTLYGANTFYYRVTATALELYSDTGSALSSAKSFAFSDYNTLEKLVDGINTTAISDSAKQWRAQLCPGANAQADPATALTLTVRAITSCVVDNTAKTITKAGGGLNDVAVGAFITGTGATVSDGVAPYVTHIVSDTSLSFSGTITDGTKTLTFVPGSGDKVTGATNQQFEGYIRVIANSLPGFLYFNTATLNANPIEKSTVWMTVASPGSIKSAANCFSARIANRHTPPLEAGISMGGFAVDNGFVVPFANKNAAIRNTRDQGTGLDSDYKLFILNESRGCCAWQSIAKAGRFGFFFSPEGWIACDLFRENDTISNAIYRQGISDATAPTGDFSYEAPLCVAATSKDDDTAYLIGAVERGVLYANWRFSAATTHPNRQTAYDFSEGGVSGGLAVAARPDGPPWGWSVPLVRSVTAMASGRRGDGMHLYGWNEENGGSTGDGRIDELETTQQDNGTDISASITAPWFQGGSGKVSFQEFTLEHSSPSGATVAFDFHRSTSDETYSLTPSTSSTLVHSRDVKQLTLPARAPTAAGYWGWRQTVGTASELRGVEMRFMVLPSFT